MSNYFAVGLGLIDHLETKRAEWGIKHVGTVASINKINKNSTPALYVINTSNNPRANGSIDSRDVQQWTVVVAVSNQAAQDNVRALMETSGELISKVINHVQGYELDDYHEPLERTTTSGRPTISARLRFIRLLFKPNFSLRGH